VELQGFCEAEFEPVKQAFVTGFDNGLEVGASVAVFQHGEPVVDLWAGYADEGKTSPWQEDTVTLVASTTKIFTGLCAHICIDRGLLDPNARVIDYWPEFGEQGKDEVLVRQIFDHTSGVAGFDPPIPWSTVLVWSDLIHCLENQKLWWEPGTQAGYHGETWGFLIGELIRRVSGLTPGKFLQQEVASKIDADFHIGFPPSEFERLSFPIIGDEGEMPFEPGSLPDRIMNGYLPPEWEGEGLLTAEIPGANGIGNARSVAKLASIYASGGQLNGHRFLSPETLELVLTEQNYMEDVVMGMPVRRGLGLGLNSEGFDLPGDRSLHWGGRGGSICIMDLDSGTSLGFVPNNFLMGMINDVRNDEIRTAYNRVVGG
jgi:CubicO group peptidase (beta-lactamase class C family)